MASQRTPPKLRPYKKDRTKYARNEKRVEKLVGRSSKLNQLPFFLRFFFFPFIYPPTLVYPAARWGGLECAFASADKFNLYA